MSTIRLPTGRFRVLPSIMENVTLDMDGGVLVQPAFMEEAENGAITYRWYDLAQEILSLRRAIDKSILVLAKEGMGSSKAITILTDALGPEDDSMIMMNREGKE